MSGEDVRLLALACGMGCMAWTGFRLMQAAAALVSEYGLAELVLVPVRLIARSAEDAVHFVGMHLFPQRYVQILLGAADEPQEFCDQLVYRGMIALFLEREQSGREDDKYTGDAHARKADGACVQLYNLFSEVERLSLDVSRGAELRRFAAREIFGHEAEQLAVKIEPLWQVIIHKAFARCTFVPEQVKDLLRHQYEQGGYDRD